MFRAEWKCGLHMWFSKALGLLFLLGLFHINGRYCVRYANTPADSIPLQCDDVSLFSLFDQEEPMFSHSVMSNSWQPMNYSTPGFPVLQYFPEFAQAHVQWVGEAIQSSHPLSLLSPPALKSFPASQSFLTSQLFTSGGQSIGTTPTRNTTAVTTTMVTTAPEKMRPSTSAFLMPSPTKDFQPGKQLCFSAQKDLQARI